MATWKRILLEGSDLTTGDIAGQAITGTTGSFSSTVSWSGGSSGNANTAYTYSQVGHLPLAGGTLTGNLIRDKITIDTDHVLFSRNGSYAASRAWRWRVDDSAWGNFDLKRSNGEDNTIDTLVLSFNNSGNATFSGTVSGTTGTFTGTLSAEQLTSTDDLTVAGLATVGETLVVTGNTTTTGDFLVSSGDPTITIKRSNNTAYAGHIDFTNSADTLGWQLGTNILVGDGTGFEINYLGSNKLSITTGGNTTVSGNLVVSGDLTISGSTTTVNTATITVEDPLIKLASGNSSADTVDIGFYGLCDPSGSQDTYTGLIRDASDGEYHLFDLLQAEPTTTMNTSGTGFDHADLTVGALTVDDTLGVTGEVTLSSHLNMGDSDIIKLGASQDLQIYHDGSHSYIKDTGTGHLRLATDEFRVSNAAVNETIIDASQDGGVGLYHNDSKKLDTTSSGISVTGTVDATNYKIGGGQGSDGQVLTSTGSGVQWEAATGDGYWDRDTSGSFPVLSQGNANDIVKVTSADGANRNTYIFEVVNLDQTADQGYGAKIQSGNNATDSTLVIRNRAGNDTAKFKGDRTTWLYGQLNVDGQNIAVDGAIKLGGSVSNGTYKSTIDNTNDNILSIDDYNNNDLRVEILGCTFESDDMGNNFKAKGNLGSENILLNTHSDFTSVTVGPLGFIRSKSADADGNRFSIASNAHYDTDGSWEYIRNDEATLYETVGGKHEFYYAAGANAGTDITFTRMLSLDTDYAVFGRDPYTIISWGNSDTRPWLASLNNENYASATYGWQWFNRSSDGDLRLTRNANSTTETNVMNIARNSGAITFYGSISTSGGTITSSSSITATGNITAGGNIDIPATSKFFLDGGGDTYIEENSANSMRFVVGTGNSLVLTSSAATFIGDVTAAQYYTSGWYRNTGETGLFNATHDTYLYWTGTQQLYARSNTTSISMKFSSDGTTNGYVYGTGTSFGLLDEGGNWAYKHNNDSSHQWMTHDTERMILYSSGYLDATRFRSRENTNYYTDPDGTSALYSLEVYQSLGMNNKDITAIKNLVPNSDNAGLVGTQAKMFDGVWTNELNSNDGTVHIQNGAVGNGYTRIYGKTGIGQAPDSNYILACTGNTYLGGSLYVTDVYASEWFRNSHSGEGMYNQATTQHWYSDDDDYWNVAGGGSANGIRFRDDHAGTVRGAVYANSSNQVGFLDSGHDWCYRHEDSGATIWFSNATEIMHLTSGAELRVKGNILAKQGSYIGVRNTADNDYAYSFKMPYGSTEDLEINPSLHYRDTIVKQGHFKQQHDSKRIMAGAGDDFQFYHNGSNSFIDNNTGGLYINNLVNNGYMYLRANNSAGSTTTVLALHSTLFECEVPVQFHDDLTVLGDYFTINNNAQNGIKIYGNDTACLYIYDKGDGSLSGGLTFSHDTAEFFVYTNGVSSNTEALKIVANNDAYFRGNIYGNDRLYLGTKMALDMNSEALYVGSTTGDNRNTTLHLRSNDGPVLDCDSNKDVKVHNQMGIGVSPTSGQLHIEKSSDGGWLSYMNNTHSGGYGLKIKAGGDSGDYAFLVETQDSSFHRFKIDGDGVTTMNAISGSDAITPILHLMKINSSGVGGNGAGAAIDFWSENADGGTQQLTSRISGYTDSAVGGSGFNGGLKFFTTSDGYTPVQALHIDHNQNATFAGKIAANHSMYIDGSATNNASGDDAILFVRKPNNNDWGLYVDATHSSSTDYGIMVKAAGNHAFYIHNGSSNTFRIGGDGAVTVGQWNATAIADSYVASSSNWNTAYTERRYWDGGANTGFSADTARNSLNMNIGNGVRFARISLGTADDASYVIKASGAEYHASGNVYFNSGNGVLINANNDGNWRKVVVAGDYTDCADHNGAIASDNWFRTYGDGGWYSNTHGGGWHMTDADWIRAYNNKQVYAQNNIRTSAAFQVGGTDKEIQAVGSAMYFTSNGVFEMATSRTDAGKHLLLNHNGGSAGIDNFTYSNLVCDTDSGSTAIHMKCTGTGTNAGYLMFGNSTSNTGGYVKYNGNSHMVLRANGNSNQLILDTDGSVDGNFVDTSDVALKTNIVSLSSGLDYIKQLRPVNFDWREFANGSGKAAGFIAQEVELVTPENVKGTDYFPTVNPDTENEIAGSSGKSINVTGIVAYLTKAVQELSVKNDALEAEVEALKNA